MRCHQKEDDIARLNDALAVAERKDLQFRMKELIAFLNEQHTAITEFRKTLTRRIVEKL